jgi:uncharacterized protein
MPSRVCGGSRFLFAGQQAGHEGEEKPQREDAAGAEGPALPSHFPELNCRTYVIHRDKPGIFFFSLDGGSRCAVWSARRFFLLPYSYAEMKIEKRGDQRAFSSNRIHGNASFVGRYRPQGPAAFTARHSLEHWLTERYCLYTYSNSRMFRGEIHHLPWPLQPATCEITKNTLDALSRDLSDRT